MQATAESSVLRHGNLRRSAALLCLTLFLTLQVFASSDALHHRLHADASAVGHNCVISLLAGGYLSVSIAATGCVLALLGFFFVLPTFSSSAVFSFDYRLAPSRGPPAS